jgi:molybdate transport system substrate-binding protein
MKHWLTAMAALALVLTGAQSARAQAQEELTIVIVGRGDNAFKDLVSRFETRTGRKVTVKLVGFVASRDTIVKGEPFDVGIVEFPHDEAVVASGNVVPDSAVSVANGRVGLAVRKGAPQPDISTPAALKRTLLAAKSIAYPDPENGTGASGVNITEMLRRLGIADDVKAKSKLTRGGGRAMAMVASGEVEIGMTYLIGMGGDQQEPGLIDIVGTLPPEVSPPVPLIGFVASKSMHPEAARELLAFLTSPEAAGVYAWHWLDAGY